jgi:hypothetical protein
MSKKRNIRKAIYESSLKHSKNRTKRVALLKNKKERLKHVEHELEEEFFVPSPVHRGKYAIPIGIKLLIGYLIFLGAFYVISFFYGITFPTTVLFGQLITGTRALFINTVLLVLIIFMIYGFWRRKAFTFDLAIGWFGFTLLNALISLVLFESREYAIFKSMLVISLISMALINILVIWYVLHERKYFYAEYFHDRAVHHRDKIFVYALVSFWTLTLLIGLTLGFSFYKHSKFVIDKTIKEMGGNYAFGESDCIAKSGEERDVCLLVLATARDQAGLAQDSSICDKIDSELYRFTCVRSISAG